VEQNAESASLGNLERFTNLQELDISGAYGQDGPNWRQNRDISVKSFNRATFELKKLTLENLTGCLKYLEPHVVCNLEELNVLGRGGESGRVDWKSLQNLWSKLPNLTRLELDFWYMDDSALIGPTKETSITNCKKLHSLTLNLKNCDKIVPILKFPNVQDLSLDFSEDFPVSNENVKSLARSNPRMESLNLHGPITVAVLRLCRL